MANCEIVYVDSQLELVHYHWQFTPGDSIEQVLSASGIYLNYPETKGLSVGVFAQSATRETLVKPGDRIEIYRPLQQDPKTLRRQKAGLKIS